MKQQYLTYYSLQWSGRIFFEESVPSTCKDIDPPTSWAFPACAAIPLQSLGTRLALLQQRGCSWANLLDPDRASHLVAVFFDVESLLWCISFLFEGSTSTMQRGLKFPILQVLQCNIPGAVYALYIFHKRRLSPESEMWEKSVHQGIYWHKQLRDFQVGDENSRYLHVWLCISLQGGGKRPNRCSGITPERGLPLKTQSLSLNVEWLFLLQVSVLSLFIWFHNLQLINDFVKVFVSTE